LLLLAVVVEAISSKKRKAPLFQIGLEENLAGISSSKYASTQHFRLTESDFRYDIIISRWRLLRHFMQQSAATW